MRITSGMRRAARRPRRTALLATLVAGGTVAALPSGAAAQPAGPIDPLTTNVPYIAWRGEQIKLAECVGLEQSRALAAQSVDVHGLNVEDFLVEDWSGADPDRAKPQIETSTESFYIDDSGRYCISADVVSPKAGIAPIKLVVSLNGQPLLKHQFLAIWMNQNDPTLTELPAGGDPTGNGGFNAGGDPGHVQVTVSGNVPLLGNYSELGPGDTLQLPSQYAALAARLAHSDDPATDGNPLLWDSHPEGTPTTATGHGPTPTGPFSAYEALTGTSFSSSATSVGPFDPTRAADTYIPDGSVDAADAPMPALRVDVSIRGNDGTGGTFGGSTDGIGTLEKVDKGAVYQGPDYYAPFYQSWIPATGYGTSSSGIDGPASGSNFVGFLNDQSRPYSFWDIAYTLRSADGGPTGCLLRGTQNRVTPSGAQSVVVYTDEHGEAQVAYRPGVNAYYDALVRPDRNGACDLQGIDPLGTANISAIARYPYQPVTDPDHTAPTTLVKTVHSLFDKSLSYESKGTTEATSNVRLVTAHAQDVNGSAFANETVCFSHDANAEAVISYGDYATVADPNGAGRLCELTDSYGNAVVEVLDSNQTVTDVIAHFTDERLFRDIKVDFSTQPTSGGTPPTHTRIPGGDVTPPPPAGSPGPAPAVGAGTATPTVRQLVAAQVPPALATQPPAGPAARTATARKATLTATIRHAANGRWSVVLRINSSHPKAKVKLLFLGRKHRTLGSVTRTVGTNRRVTIALGKLSSRTRTVHVTLIG